ncbi:LptF/LptG family permease [Elusimicrobiota bacterium]
MKIFACSFYKEYIGNFMLGIAIFTLFFFFGKFSDLLEAALMASGGDIVLFVSTLGFLSGQYYLSVFAFILPMTLLFGVNMTISRLQEDRELLAYQALGIRISSWIWIMVIPLALLFCAVEYHLVNIAMPEAKHIMKTFAHDQKHMIENIKVLPKTWADFKSAKIFAEKVSGNTLEDVVLYVFEAKRGKTKRRSNKKEQPFLYKVTSRGGIYEGGHINEKDPSLHFVLNDGKLETPDLKNPGNVTVSNFKEFEVYVTMEDQEKSRARPWKEQKTERILDALKKNETKEARVELSQRINLTLAPIVLAIGGILIALGLSAKTKAIGFGVALGLILLYWMAMVFFITIEQPLLTNPAYLALTLAIRLLL